MYNPYFSIDEDQQKLQDANFVEARVDAVGKLREKLRAAGYLMLRRTATGEVPKKVRDDKLHQRLAKELKTLSDKELDKLIDTVFPKLAVAIRGAFDVIDRSPIDDAPMPIRASDATVQKEQRCSLLAALAQQMYGIDKDASWLIEHGTRFWWSRQPVSLVFAGAIDRGDDALLAKLQELCHINADAEHFNDSIVAGLMMCDKPEAWETVAKLLKAAQRQEGLRQMILEPLPNAHPGAFRRILQIMLDDNMERFASVARAVDVWMSLRWDSAATKQTRNALERAATFLDDESARVEALEGNDAETAYFAMWAAMYDDARVAMQHASQLLKHRKVEMRAVGVLALASIIYVDELRDDVRRALLPVIEDDDRLAFLAIEALGHNGDRNWVSSTQRKKRTHLPELYEALKTRLEKTPKRGKAGKPLIWPWITPKLSRSDVADAMLGAQGDRPWSDLLPVLPDMSSHGRYQFIQTLCHLKAPERTDGARNALLTSMADASSSVREEAVKGLRKYDVSAKDAPMLEDLLSRKAADTRRAAIELLLKLPDDAALASAENLTSEKAVLKRVAGLELLRELAKAKRGSTRPAELATSYQQSHETLSSDEQQHIEAILGNEETLTFDNALGLMDPAKLTPVVSAKRKKVRVTSKASVELVKQLDALVDKHRDEPVVYPRKGDDEVLDTSSNTLGSSYGLRTPTYGEAPDLKQLPLAEIWTEYWDNRGKETRDADGLEVERASYFISQATSYLYRMNLRTENDATKTEVKWFLDLKKDLEVENLELKHGGVVRSLLEWMQALDPKPAADFWLDVLEDGLARWVKDDITRTAREASDTGKPFLKGGIDWCRDLVGPVIGKLRPFITERRQRPGMPTPTPEQQTRYIQLLRLLDRPWPGVARKRMEFEEYELAHRLGLINEHDWFDALIGPKEFTQYSNGFNRLSTATARLGKGSRRRRRHSDLTLPTDLANIIKTARDRVIDIELKRGEKATIATNAATVIENAGGGERFLEILVALGKDKKLRRTQLWGWSQNESKAAVLSSLLKQCNPEEDETAEAFAELAGPLLKSKQIAEDRLVAAAISVPGFADHVEAALGWDGFADGVWWIHAHTKTPGYHQDEEDQAEIRKRTPLETTDLNDGAVDVAWFGRAYQTLGKKHWEVLIDNAKFASESAGHTRSVLFSNTMLGNVTKTSLAKDVKEKRKQDALRALGLLKLQGGAKQRKDLLDRYKIIAEFRRTSKQFGNQRQASEKRAADIASENLARTAGYADPIRLQWAMETEAIADLAGGNAASVTVKDPKGDITVSLRLDDEGSPHVDVDRDGKTLKAVPAKAKKDRKVKELTARKTELRRTASRMRQSLELAMVRGDAFESAELIDLFGNPILAPMLERLVFLTDGGDRGETASVAGYPIDGGKALRDAAGNVEPIKKDESLRLAHPADLLKRDWTAWQRDVFSAERVQPFKQVFRKLYVPTGPEVKAKADHTARYAGQQVHPRQAMALLGSRGWVTAPEEGVFRVDHDLGMVSWIEFQEGFYSPADVDGLTVEHIRFAKRGEYKSLNLGDVPERLFSETMRDVDLVVSVAHRGGVDPEASASTVEMRGNLLRETLELLGVDNVTLKAPARQKTPTHAIIKGGFGEYSVHLGSGSCHKMPGGMLFIVPVHSQHRGRLFLPFADDDPKTAEVLSKVLMLADDRKIKDPSVLDQIRS